MKNGFFLFMLAGLCSLSILSLSAESASEKSDKENIYHLVRDYYQPVLSKRMKIEKNESKQSQKQNADQMAQFKEKKKFFVSSINVPRVGPAEKANLMYSILSSSSEAIKDYPEVLNQNVFNDLEMLCGYAPDFGRSVFGKLDYTTTTVGKIQLQKMLCTPTTDVQELTKRQRIVKALVDNPKLREQLEARLDVIQDVENELVWMWKEIQAEILAYFEEAYFQWDSLKGLNKSEVVLEAETLRIFSMPIVNIFSSNIILYLSFSLYRHMGIFNFDPLDPRWHAGMLCYSGFILSLQYFAFGINVFAPAINHHNICDKLQKKMMNVSAYIRSVNAMGKIISADSELAPLFTDAKKLAETGVVSDEAKGLIESLQSDTFKGKASFFSNYGRVLAAFKTLQDVKNNIVNGLAAAGDIDAYVSLAKLYSKHESGNGAQFCFVDFEQQETPHLKIEGFWHPMLDPKTVVTNDLELGAAVEGNNVVLTGPNAGGKSTVLKATALAAWLAQTTGLAPASSMSMTPFAKINTYLNITDKQGKESLFQAEMHRAQLLLNCIKNLQPYEFDLVIMDEIFTGTNPKEGEAGAYGVAKHLAKYPNNIAIVATHFKELTNLEETTGGFFKNYKVSVNKEDGKFVYPYKLERGISDQPIALQLLENEGFDSEILEEAQAIMARAA